jgi:hypothetical protein
MDKGNCIDCANDYLRNREVCNLTRAMSIVRTRNNEDIVLGDAFSL